MAAYAGRLMAAMASNYNDGVPVDDVKLRPCLMCRKDFMSSGRGHRRCKKCENRLLRLTLSKVEQNGGRIAGNFSRSGEFAEENITNTQ